MYPFLDQTYFYIFSFLIMSSITNLLIPYPCTVGLLGPICSIPTQFVAYTYPWDLHIPCLCPDTIVPELCFVLLQLGYPKLTAHDSTVNSFPSSYSATLFGIFPPLSWFYSSLLSNTWKIYQQSVSASQGTWFLTSISPSNWETSSGSAQTLFILCICWPPTLVSCCLMGSGLFNPGFKPLLPYLMLACAQPVLSVRSKYLIGLFLQNFVSF